MNNLTIKEISELNTLYRKYVSTRHPFNLLELYGSIRHEASNAEKGVIGVMPGLMRELRRDRARVGYLAHKAIGRDSAQLKQPFAPYANYSEWLLNRF